MPLFTALFIQMRKCIFKFMKDFDLYLHYFYCIVFFLFNGVLLLLYLLFHFVFLLSHRMLFFTLPCSLTRHPTFEFTPLFCL